MKSRVIGQEISPYNENITMLKLESRFPLTDGVYHMSRFDFPILTVDSAMYPMGTEIDLEISSRSIPKIK